MMARRFVLLLPWLALCTIGTMHSTAIPMSKYLGASPPAYYQRIYEQAWQKIQENYVHREKLLHWESWRHKYDRTLTDKRQLVAAINQMIDALDDDYTYLLSDQDVSERAHSYSLKQVVHGRRLNNNIGYIKLDNFTSEIAVTQFAHQLRNLSSCQGFILDLRNNHGGFINIADQIFAMLANKGIFMTYQGYANGAADLAAYVLHADHWQLWHNGINRETPRTADLVLSKPLLVLINSDTRSAAELLAGSLRDGRKAHLLGTTTYGKGVLQDAYELGDKLILKVTTAKYYLPGGTNIHGKGLVPDYIVKQQDGTDTQLQIASTMLCKAIAESHKADLQVSATQEQSETHL